MDWRDTIIGAANAWGLGERAILRISGPLAPQLLARQTEKDSFSWQRPFSALVAWPVWERAVTARILAWPAGRSYTGQETLELHLPACAPLVHAIQSQCLALGARLARPGEFTLRAFLRGRMDLAQAEAVLGMVTAEDLASLRGAIDQRAGGISQPISAAREQLLDLLADLEAGLDFVEEDISFVTHDELVRRLDGLWVELTKLAKRCTDRAWQNVLPRVVLVGEPNAGKSSLFNALLGEPRALVSDIAGTTRDYLVGQWDLGTLRVELVDTAGFSDDGAELFAGESARQRDLAVGHADLVLHCRPCSASQAPHPSAETGGLLVRTKADLERESSSTEATGPFCSVSIHDAASLARLREWVRESLASRPSDTVYDVGTRCREGLDAALSALNEARALAQDRVDTEFLVLSLRAALDALGLIVGAVYTDDLLDRVFSRFCIGK